MGQSLHRGQLSSLGQGVHRSQLGPPGHERGIITQEPGKSRSPGPGVPRGQTVTPVHAGDMTTQESGKRSVNGASRQEVVPLVSLLSSLSQPNSGLPPACARVV